MNFEKLRTVSTVLLIDVLDNALKEGEQDIANIVAYELTCRVWVPNAETSFEDMLRQFGYKDTQNKVKKLRPSSNG